jgi:hypothetical protein
MYDMNRTSAWGLQVQNTKLSEEGRKKAFF